MPYPEHYPRRILLCVTGLSPQVVTETLYALAVGDASPRWIPTEIRLITTAKGAEHARLSLLSEQPGWFHRLCTDYQLPPIAFDEQHIHILTGPDGAPLEDIRRPADNERAADFITEVIRGLTEDTTSALHVSIAGGRKTMGFYLGYALSLFGRRQDCLSHVLVSAPFESHPEFYYPTPQQRVIHTLDRQQLAVDSRTAEVTLARIPLVRLREELPHRFTARAARLTEIIAAANRAFDPPRLELEVATRTASADAQTIDLNNTTFLVLLWLASRCLDGNGEVDWSHADAAREYLAIARQVIPPMSGDYQRIEEALNWRAPAPIQLARYFEPHKSRINNALQAALGKAASARYAIVRSGPKGESRYALPLTAEQITILR